VLGNSDPQDQSLAFKSAKAADQIETLAQELRQMLAKIESGDVDATVTMRHRIEGAIVALDVIQGRSQGLGDQVVEN
jgi:hypothetical protein